MRKLTIGALIAISASFANATVFTYTSALNGFEVVPPTTSPAIASIVFALDNVALTLSGSGQAQFISGGSPTVFDIHQAPFGANGPIVQNIGPSAIFGNGNIGFTLTLPNLAALNSLKAIMDARGAYVDIHTPAFTAGELRGQISPVPEPASMAALAIGGAALLRRRKRK